MGSKKKRAHGRRPRTAIELILEKRTKTLRAAERTHWETINALRTQRENLVRSLELPIQDRLPASISSTVWALKDGAAFVRYKTVDAKPRLDFRVLPITLEEWGRTGLIVPLDPGEVSLAQIGLIAGVGNISRLNCKVNDLEIPYAEFAHIRYGDEANLPSVERAVLDFQLVLLGLQMQGPAAPGPVSVTPAETIAALKKLAAEFATLLDAQGREEELQLFLKRHPFILHPSAECIPKQKLGEDFVTDFVLVETTTQGPRYVLVELERVSHVLLTKDLILSGPVNHAIKQTRDWDVWLERNKTYIQNKLAGFETPTFLVIIGRGNNLSEDEKAYLRSYNREWKHIQLLTYDDVLSRFTSTIANLEAMSRSEGGSAR